MAKITVDELPELLAHRIANKQCVAFVGAGFSMPCGMPGWSGLLAEIVRYVRRSKSKGRSGDDLKQCEEAIAEGSLADAADRLRAMISPADYQEVMSTIFGNHVFHQAAPDIKARMMGRMRNLVTIPWAGILTTNYDNLIEFSLDQHVFQEVVKTTGSNSRLGTVLSSAPPDGLFFVKIHGTLSEGNMVLTTEDYVREYLKADSIQIFLSALMLRYHIVFIGCSLEDEIVRLRQALSAKFGGMIPAAYALIKDGALTAVRIAALEKNAKIDPLIYPSTDTKHDSVDEFLATAAAFAGASKPSSRPGRGAGP